VDSYESDQTRLERQTSKVILAGWVEEAINQHVQIVIIVMSSGNLIKLLNNPIIELLELLFQVRPLVSQWSRCLQEWSNTFNARQKKDGF